MGVTNTSPRFSISTMLSAALLGITLATSSTYTSAQKPAADSAKTDLLQWRAERAKQLSAPDGWLTLVGLEWLKPGRNTIGLSADNSIRLKANAPDHLCVIDVEGTQ